MKRFISALIAVIAVMAFMAIPASAASLGISPSHIEIEVPGGGSTPANFQVHYFSGELRVSLVDIPLEVEPTVFHITSSPTDIVVTFRDNTFDPQEYNGYVRFFGMSQDTVALAVNIKARVTVKLSANIVEKPAPSPPPAPAPGVGAPTYYTKTDLFGVGKNYRISRTGEILRTIEATSEDGMLTFTIPKGTVALGKDGKRLKGLEVAVDESPPPRPWGAYIVGLAYDFGPVGATFDPPITFTWSYDPDIPEGVAEEDLVIAYYDEGEGEWVECPCTCDVRTHCVTASVGHFTGFAIIAPAVPPLPLPAPAAFTVSELTIQPAEVQLEEAVTITVSVANTGGTEGTYTVVLMIKGVKEVEKRVTIAAGGSQDVSFTVTKEEAGSYTVAINGLTTSFTVLAPPVPAPAPAPAPVPEVKPPFNWPLVGGIIGGVVIVGLLVFFLVVRRRASPLPQGEGD